MPFTKVEPPAGRLPDDQVSIGSLDYSDEYTLPGDNWEDDAFSDISVETRDSFDSFTVEEQLPSYRVPRDQGAKQPVYEAWILRYTGDSKEVVNGTKICGIEAFEFYDKISGFVSTRAEPFDQAELRDMHVAAINKYQASHKRSLPSRLVRGRAISYEQDVDARVRKLPATIQKELNDLLGDREVASGNRLRRRDWTVAMMREQLHYRFGSAAFEEVKRHKVRFWKNPAKDQPIEYLFILRGAEGAVAKDATKGIRTARRFGNPWKNVDEEERRAYDRMRRMKGYEKDGLKAPRITVHRRAVSPPPPRHRQPYRCPPRPRSISPLPPPPVDILPARVPQRPFISVAPPPPPPPAPAPNFPLSGVPPIRPAARPYYPAPYQAPYPAAPRPCSFAPVSTPPMLPAPSFGVGAYSHPFTPTHHPGYWNTTPTCYTTAYSAPPPVPPFGSSFGHGYVPYAPAVVAPPPMSPPRFPPPPPPPMPSNLTTPTFTASDRSNRSKEGDAERVSVGSVGSVCELDDDVDEKAEAGGKNSRVGSGVDGLKAKVEDETEKW
ncbi:hypothetical protein NKR23_g10205 [Pleurostoma richardsiae]|uniref:Uncharacterized protein n=1 Tax=Pleurostoma richardsiae TaxID=41990 RepID=A0AA38RDS0_9PEZI|nr:hypothetical protein NKR23_g10205 [Pleurostoma richardsiae]